MSDVKQDGWAGHHQGKAEGRRRGEIFAPPTMNDIEAFSEMTGDRNPLPYDRALAEAPIFGKLIVQGGVTSGMLNAAVAENLPGPGTVFLGVEWKFIRAVGVDEPITARIEITDMRDDKPICKILTSVRNEAGGTCLSGTATVYTVPLARA